MSTFFIICAAIASVLTFLVIIVGVVSVGKDKEFREKYGNKLMQARVILQATAILMLVLAFSTS